MENWEGTEEPEANSPVHECILQQRCYSVDVVLAHLSDVLEQEGKGLQHAVLNVELWHPVLVHERRQDRERRAGLSDDGNGHGRADSVLTLLHLQVVEQGGEDVVGAEGGERGGDLVTVTVIETQYGPNLSKLRLFQATKNKI